MTTSNVFNVPLAQYELALTIDKTIKPCQVIITLKSEEKLNLPDRNGCACQQALTRFLLFVLRMVLALEKACYSYLTLKLDETFLINYLQILFMSKTPSLHKEGVGGGLSRYLITPS